MVNKKRGMLLFSVMAAVLMLASIASASLNTRVYLLQKDPATWQPIPFVPTANKPFAPQVIVDFWNGQYFKAYGNNLPKNTQYTLIYYGDATHNDVWPFATCLKSGKTTSWGSLQALSGRLNYAVMLTNGVAEKFWLVPSSDVNCTTGVMTAWNPTKIFFEDRTI